MWRVLARSRFWRAVVSAVEEPDDPACHQHDDEADLDDLRPSHLADTIVVAVTEMVQMGWMCIPVRSAAGPPMSGLVGGRTRIGLRVLVCGGALVSRDERPPAPEPLPHPVVDNHCHLDMARDRAEPTPLEQALKESAAVGVPRVVHIGCDLDGARWAVDAATRHDALVAGVALHANEAPRLAAAGELDAALDEIETLVVSSERV